MPDLYYLAKMAWVAAMPEQLRKLHNRDNEHVYEALKEVLNDVLSDSWLYDSKVAWKLMTLSVVGESELATQ